MERFRNLVAIPAYNEELNIEYVLTSMFDLQQKFDLIVFDDGSTDNTASICTELGFKVVKSSKNRGYETTLNDAYQYALIHHYDTITYLDADGEHDPSLLPMFLSNIQFYVVLCGRRKYFNRFSERFIGLLNYTYCRVSDPYCGMKSYNLNKIKRSNINKRPGDSIGIGLMLEVVKKCGQQSIKEIPISGRKRFGKSRYSASRFRVEIKLILNYLKTWKSCQ